MRSILMLTAVSGTLMLAAPAFAASGRTAEIQTWCLGGGGGNANAGECVYRSLEQCDQDRIAQGGNCYLNPAGPGASPDRGMILPR